MPRSGNTTDRGYGADHRELRKQWTPIVNAGRASCSRCGYQILPGTKWDLGHDDHDRSRYTGPEHRHCNRRAGAVKTNTARRMRRVMRSGAVTKLKW